MSDETTNETTEEEQQPEQAPVEIPAAEPEESTEPELEPAAEAETAEAEAAAKASAEEAPAAGASEPQPAAEQAEPQAERAAEAEGGGTSARDLEVSETGKKQRSRKHVPRSERRPRTKAKREQATARKPIVRLEKPEHERGRRQERRGVVVSDAMDKTIVVKVDTVKSHRRYKKVIRRSVKFHAHDEQNQAHVGDVVRIVETRPLSKTKNWRLAEVLEAAK
jgi:small subunit ribosomal protein S17